MQLESRAVAKCMDHKEVAGALYVSRIQTPFKAGQGLNKLIDARVEGLKLRVRIRRI